MGVSEWIVYGVQSSWVGILGCVIAFILYVKFPALPGKLSRCERPISILFERKFFFDEIYGSFIVQTLELFAKALWKIADIRMIDGAVNGAGALCEVGGEVIRGSQTGHVRTYAIQMFIGGLIIIFFYLLG